MKNPDLHNALAAVREVADEIFVSVRDKARESALEIAFPGTELYFQFNADNQLDLYKTCVLYVDDAFKSLLTDKGSGIQSAIIIGLFTYYTQHVNIITSALLCIEEPELYLHPHARRLISDRLTDFIGDKNQVIITTHSAEFLRSSGEDVNVIVLSKDATRYDFHLRQSQRLCKATGARIFEPIIFCRESRRFAKAMTISCFALLRKRFSPKNSTAKMFL